MKEMKSSKKGSLMILAVAILSMMLSACTGNNGNTSTNPTTAPPTTNVSNGTNTDEEEQKPDNSEEVKLIGYLLGEAPKGMPDVMAALNEKLKQDINATLELNYIGWGDVASKYPLIHDSGEDVDFVFAADWNYYISESNKGAFAKISDERFKTYMPRNYAKQDPAAYEAAKVNGKQYMIPTTTP